MKSAIIAAKVIGTLFVGLGMLWPAILKRVDYNFQPPIYQSVLYWGWAIVALASIWIR